MPNSSCVAIIMPLGVKPCCVTCKTTNSQMWRRSVEGEIQCNSCSLKQHPAALTACDNGGGKPVTSSKSSNDSQNGNNHHGRFREGTRKSSRSSRSMRYKQMLNAGKSHLATKGKSRRVVFKRNPLKSPEAVSTVVTSNSIFYRGMYHQVGDIVSLLDEGGGIYYAQIRGFMQDQYCDKSAVITWLLPSQASSKDHFDPATYVLGPEEDLPRKMEYMEFVCHAPSDYYKARNTPYEVIPVTHDTGYIWTSIAPSKPPSTTEIFSGSR
ncbi:GATAD1-like transcription factor [Saccoglossus kowalevskii]|uniref:GATA zinc finger domain-containing protein 1 n=1 Tax=Saccoglossus kowalevskii TaxID=10224 RepID=D1LX25_SACKO|nr:GATAD1-like transcription factor [Saccoglossus kowalevskii]ACY92531.1 GATAD1-like transcription factor [Saccoglossus kowalevskii]